MYFKLRKKIDDDDAADVETEEQEARSGINLTNKSCFCERAQLPLVILDQARVVLHFHNVFALYFAGGK